MKTPPFLLFAALLFWGWQSELLWVGAVAGIVLELARFVKWRWELEDVDFNRIWSLCVLVIVALAGYLLTTSSEGGGLGGFIHGAAAARANSDSPPTPIAVFRWLPLIWLPFVGAQFYNVRSGVPLTAVSIVLRLRRRRGEDSLAGKYLDVSYPYFIVCVFAAGVHPNHGSHSYFWGQAALIVWALLELRWRRGHRFSLTETAVSFAAIVAVLALGFVGEAAIGQFERAMQNLNVRLLARFLQTQTDAAQSVTSMGQIGEMKLSPRIVIRLQPEKVGVVPNYLREASYRNYSARSLTWRAGGSQAQNEFASVTPQPDNTTWIFLSNKVGTATVNIACYLNGRSNDENHDPQGVLPLPSGTCRLLNLPNLTSVISLQTNRTGAALATGSGLMIFDARFGPGATFDSPPDTSTNQFDSKVPDEETNALARVIAEMNFAATNEMQTRLAVAEFFASKFSYSTWQGNDKRATTNATSLTRFLLASRTGHCEYFATATVLLLRQLGIPARYAVGYAVHEPSGSGYVVRERDAHAWCLVWNRDKKAWEDFDTTPASWIAIEGGRSPFLDWLSDLRSWIGFQLEKLRYRQANLRQYILWTLTPVMAVLVYYIIFQRRAKRRASPGNAQAEAPIVWPGHDSAFYRLEKILATRGLSREPNELLSDWLERALAEPGLAELRAPLRELLNLHYRYRFDPHGLTASEKNALMENVERAMKTLAEK